MTYYLAATLAAHRTVWGYPSNDTRAGFSYGFL